MIAETLLIIGGVLIVISAIGCMRLPDFYSRLHAACVGDSCGGPMVLFAISIANEFSLLFSAKIILLIGFLLVTNVTASTALARAAHVSGLKPND